MKSMSKSIRIIFAAFILSSLASVSPSTSMLHAQEAKPRVAVIPVSIADKNNIQLNIISDRVTETAGLILRFMNEYEYVKDPVPLSGYSREEMLAYCTREKIDNLVYGRAVQEIDDSYTIEMSVFSREAEETTTTRKEKAESALDIFSTTDRITFSLIEGFSGRHIAFGSIAITFASDKGSFIPFIDGEEFPADTDTFRQVLTGDRTVQIKQNRMTGTYVIHTEKITVKEGAESSISLVIPYLLEDEQEVLSEFDKIIEKNRDKLSRKDKVTDAYNKIDSLLIDTPYNLSLSELRDKYRNERAAWEAELAAKPVLDKREIIIGFHAGAGISNVKEAWENDSENPYDVDEINSQNNLGPTAGFFLEYQLLNNISLQAEYNRNEKVYYKEDDGTTHYIKTTEIPLMLKYMIKTDIGRFAILMGAAYHNIYDEGNMIMPELADAYLTEDGIGPVAGIEYSYKINRHVFNLGIRASSINVLEYTAVEGEGDFRLDSSTVEFLVGYGYNFGGKGNKVQTEESREKWLFPVHAGFMYMQDSDSPYSPLVEAGFLYRFTETKYFGLTGFALSEGGGPLLTMAWTKDPDRVINSIGFIIMPMQDMIIGAGGYNFAWKRFSIGAIFGGPLDDVQHIAYGLAAGYYF
ncbi:MAG: porin family protein [Spirochaetales bacterium]|nr:porin family protein [Spirochaetales bacterium]